MRPFALLVVVGLLAAAEPLPVLDLDFEADGPRPPAPIAALWDRALADAATWAADRSGVAVAAPGFAGITSLRLAGAALPGPTGVLQPWAAGWVDGLDPAAEASLTALVAHWPGYALRRGGDGRTVVEAAGIVPPHRITLPGWRVSVHGPYLAALLEKAGMPGEADEATRERLRDLLAGWEPNAITSLDGSWIDTGLPAGWFTAPDPRIAARLPAGAVARAVVAVDGMAVADGFERVFPRGRLPFFLTGLRQMPGASLRGVASALTGTWAGWWDGAEGGLLCLPRSAVGDGMLRLLAAEEKWILPVDADTVAVGPGVVGACTAESWIFASDAAHIAAWLAEPAAAPPLAAGELVIGGEALARLLAELPLELVAQLPLSDALHGGGGGARREAVIRYAGLSAMPQPGWREAAGALAGLGESRIRLVAHDDGLRLELGGAVLPWVVPALGLRAFADHGQNLVGTDLLRRTVARLQAEGVGALPSDLLPDVPAIDLERLEAAERAVATVKAALAACRSGGAWRRARSEGVPLADPAAQAQLPALLAVVEASAVLDAPDFPACSTMNLRRAALSGSAAAARGMELSSVPRNLTMAARDLAALGRPEAMDLLRRARRFAARPSSLMDALMEASAGACADDTVLALGATGVVPPADLEAWLDEPADPGRLARCWHGERLLYTGWLIARWLGLSGRLDGAVEDGPGQLDLETGMGIAIQPFGAHFLQADLAEDLVALIGLMRGLEAGRPIADGAALPRSYFGLSLTPSLSNLGMLADERAASRGLVRLALRLQRLGTALPADGAAAAAAVGALEVPFAAARLPVLYQRLPAGGFTVFLDPAANRPDSMRAERWKRWIAPARANLVERFAVMPDGRLAVIIAPAAPAPAAVGPEAAPANDF